MEIIEFVPCWRNRVFDFCNQNIGHNYLPMNEIEILSSPENKGVSFILVVKDQVKAVRLTYNTGLWMRKFTNRPLTPAGWGIDENDVAYFQSISILKEHRGSGWGPKMSKRSLDKLRDGDVKGVLTHASAQSPGNASFKYLTSMGFKKVAEYPLYWNQEPGSCHVCNQPKCVCTAFEMLLKL